MVFSSFKKGVNENGGNYTKQIRILAILEIQTAQT